MKRQNLVRENWYLDCFARYYCKHDGGNGGRNNGNSASKDEYYPDRYRFDDYRSDTQLSKR